MENTKITFADGTSIETEINGNNYIIDEKPKFPTDLSKVTIEYEDGTVDVYRNAKVVETYPLDNRYWFSFIERSEIEVRFAEIEDALCDLSRE